MNIATIVKTALLEQSIITLTSHLERVTSLPLKGLLLSDLDDFVARLENEPSYSPECLREMKRQGKLKS